MGGVSGGEMWGGVKRKITKSKSEVWSKFFCSLLLKIVDLSVRKGGSFNTPNPPPLQPYGPTLVHALTPWSVSSSHSLVFTLSFLRHLLVHALVRWSVLFTIVSASDTDNPSGQGEGAEGDL